MARLPVVIKVIERGSVTSVIERGPRGVGIPPSGAPGQVVGYDANGNPAALDPTAASIPAGAAGQVLGYGPGGSPVAINIPAPAISDDPGQIIEQRADGLFASLPLSSSNW